MGRFPPWLVKRLPVHPESAVPEILSGLKLATVCSEARCPNRAECYAQGTATFLIMGTVCTRNCRFCAVSKGSPAPLDPDEPDRVAEAAKQMGLKYIVVTSVTRDDLPDGGAAHFARTVQAVKSATGADVEVLVPDFRGDTASVYTVLASHPAVFNHNVETIPRLYPDVRPMADYGRSLLVLRHAARTGAATKSGLMVGFGETEDEVLAVLSDLRDAGVQYVTIGQYLAPSGAQLPVAEFVQPEIFEKYARAAEKTGFSGVASSPFVRSSYHAASLAGHEPSGTIQ